MIEPHTGDDYVDCGAGTDQLTYYESLIPLKAYLNATYIYLTADNQLETDNIINCENLEATNFNDLFVGTNVANVFWGRSGVNFQFFNIQNDTFIGLRGNDVFHG